MIFEKRVTSRPLSKRHETRKYFFNVNAFICELTEVRYSPTGAGFELDIVHLAGVVDELDAGVLLPVPHRLHDVRLHVI